MKKILIITLVLFALAGASNLGNKVDLAYDKPIDPDSKVVNQSA